MTNALPASLYVIKEGVTRTIMGPHGINRAVHRIAFSDCENGLGIKVIGGFKEQTGEEYGIYVKRVLHRGVAANDGRLQAGDLILEVNGEDLAGVTNDRAVDVLRTASASSHMSLLITRDEESRREFAELMEKYGSHSNAGSARSSPTPHSPGRLAESPCCSTCSGSLSPKDTSPFAAAPTLATAAAAAAATSAGSVQTVTVPRGLGLNVTTGNNRPPGPLTSGGDSTKVRGGEQLVSINKESLLGVTQDETPSPPGLRPESSVEMASVRRGSVAGEGPLPSPPSPGMKPPGFSFLLAPPNYRRGPGPPTGAPSPDRPLQGKSAAKKLDVSPSGSPTHSLPDPHSPAAVGAGWTQPSVTRGRSLSLNPSFRLKVEKLEMALGYLGIEPSPEQQHILRTQLLVDSNGTVAYGDFVQAARDMFRLQLDESASEPTASTLTSTCSPPETPLSTQVLPPGTAGAGDLDRTSRERNEALKELKKVKDQLAQSEKSRKALSEELQKVRQEARCAVEEGRSLRGRAHLAEAAQRQARGMEMDYEEVVRLLEAEISELKAQRGHSKDDTQDLRKRLAVMDCQLRKSEAARKTFQLATGKLLQFVEMDLPTDTPAARTNACPGARRFSQPAAQSLARSGPGFTGITGGKVTALSSQAQELCTSVRALIEADCLPYGWEESHTADGTKYFINHVTQTTSWVHPVTSALPRADRARDTTSREPPDFNS